jgi:hypothetical protein
MHTAIELPAGRFSLLIAPDRALEYLLDPVASLAWGGPLLILDGGNSFNVYQVARHIERRRPAWARQQARQQAGRETGLDSILANIQVARAFTCYQVVALLSSTPATPAPTLVLDMLATFAPPPALGLPVGIAPPEPPGAAGRKRPSAAGRKSGER